MGILTADLVRSEITEGGDFKDGMSRAEIEAQMKTLMFAGYETTSSERFLSEFSSCITW